MFYDGGEVGNDPTKSSGSKSAGDGRIVVGRIYTESEGFYTSVVVDELIFFNQALTVDDIETLYQSV